MPEYAILSDTPTGTYLTSYVASKEEGESEIARMDANSRAAGKEPYKKRLVLRSEYDKSLPPSNWGPEDYG